MSNIVTRFAPSPTGHLHLGGARTAIFNWLLARSAQGRFLLRIEDTDRARSSQEMTDAILDSMQWLGLDWDGEPIYQSQRFDLYNEHIDRLIAEGKAYYCQCSPEEVEAMREQARQKGEKPKYNGRCRELGLGPGPGRVVRFKGPLSGKTVFNDMVKGTVAVDHAELDDMILRRTDGAPTYNLAVVVDDHALEATHVLRGDDHINNTPRQILLYQAFGWDIPQFGHVPLIHGQDKKKLSKRHGALSVMEYEKQGFLPEAMLNYLVKLGWSSGDQEIFSRQELLDAFTPENLSRSAAAFDMEKLLWLNSNYIKEANQTRLAALLAEQLKARGLADPDPARLAGVVPLYQPRARTMAEMAEMSEFFFLPDEQLPYDQKAVTKFLNPETKPHLADVKSILAGLEQFNQQSMEEAVKNYLDQKQIKFKILAQPIRVALSGKTASPGLFETMEVLGQQSCSARFERALGL